MIKNTINKIKDAIRRIKDRRKLPIVTLPYQEEVRRVQKRWFFSFLILSVFALWYSYQFSKYKEDAEKLTTVWVSTSNISAPQKVSMENFSKKEIPYKYLPEGAWDIEIPLDDKTVIQNIRKNQIVVTDHLQSDIDPESISTSFGENYAFSLDESWLASKLPEVQKNDLLDIVITNPKAEEDETRVIVSKAVVLDIIEAKNGRKTLILNISQEDAQLVLFSHGLKLPMQVLVYPSIKKQ